MSDCRALVSFSELPRANTNMKPEKMMARAMTGRPILTTPSRMVFMNSCTVSESIGFTILPDWSCGGGTLPCPGCCARETKGKTAKKTASDMFISMPLILLTFLVYIMLKADPRPVKTQHLQDHMDDKPCCAGYHQPYDGIGQDVLGLGPRTRRLPTRHYHQEAGISDHNCTERQGQAYKYEIYDFVY